MNKLAPRSVLKTAYLYAMNTESPKKVILQKLWPTKALRLETKSKILRTK